MVDHDLLDDFMRRFFGYGSWQAKLWFIGMEEGGGSSMEEIEKRLQAWERSDELADLHEYQPRHRWLSWFGELPKIQTTWAKLIRIVLAAAGRPTPRWPKRTEPAV